MSSHPLLLPSLGNLVGSPGQQRKVCVCTCVCVRVCMRGCFLWYSQYWGAHRCRGRPVGGSPFGIKLPPLSVGVAFWAACSALGPFLPFCIAVSGTGAFSRGSGFLVGLGALGVLGAPVSLVHP